MQRRQFLQAGLSFGLLSSFGISSAANNQQRILSASDTSDGLHQVSRITLGQAPQHVAIPFRAHDVMEMPDGRVIAYGRRPDPECALVDFNTQSTTPVKASSGRHFYGHGCLSQDKTVLFTTENDYDGKRAVLGIRDAKTLTHIGEYDTYGIGAHDVHLMPDGKTLVVANGGIETHPDFGRRKLNLKTMQPSLVYIDAYTGKKIDEYRLEDHLLSIRHLTISEQGDVGVALQYQGKLYRQQPKALVAWQQAGKDLKALEIDSLSIRAFSGYMADLAYDASRKLLAVTSPRGNHITFWNTDSLSFIHAQALPEPSGIVFDTASREFIVSSAKGGVYRLSGESDAEVQTVQLDAGLHWDNHMIWAS